MGARRWLLLLLVGAATALLIARGLAQLYADFLWYAALGAADVWKARYSSLLILRLCSGIVATLFVFANLYAVRQSVVSLVLPRRIGNLDIGEEVPRRQLTWTAAALSVLIGLALAWSQHDWSGFLAARIGLPFGESDPYFASDLGFFVYRLPFELSLFTWTMTMVLIVIFLVVLLYALTPSLRWEHGGLYVSGYVRRHLAMLAGVLLLVLAWHYRLEMYTMLGDGSAVDGAFTSVDHRVGIPASILLSLVTLGAGLTVLWAGWSGQMRLAFAALTGVIVAAIAARQLAPFVAKRAMGERDPVVRERPYEATRAGYTRRAFGVDRISVADSGLAFQTLGDAMAAVPAWDEGVLRRAADRPIPGAGVGWVAGDSGVAAIVATSGASGVLLHAAALADENGGVVRIPLPEGTDVAPVLIAPDSSTRPTIIADSTGRVVGTPLSDGWTRFNLALSMQDFRVWLGALPSPSPKLVSRRNVRERVAALAPFFDQGSAVTPILYADTLLWTVELYSTSRTYPLSRRTIVGSEDVAYYQHAATAIVNAATGRTVLIADSLPDAIASTWMTRFPRLFTRATMLPIPVRRQLPPARESARVQASAFARYGTRSENDVVRHLPDDDGADSALVDTPLPLLALPRAGITAFVQPVLDRNERLRGLFLALGGTAHRSVWLPLPQPSLVWSEALDQLRAADTVRAGMLVRGWVRAVPINGSVVLVQPRYEWRSGSVPRLMYVSALAGDSVRSARTLMQLAGRMPDSVSPSSGDFRARVHRLYDEMRRAASRGDWAAYGRAFDALGALLRERP